MNEQTQNDYTDNNDYEIAVIGAGGIGSHLTSALVPALHRGGLLGSTGGITIRVYDSDTVTDENLAHQRFNYQDVGMHKVAAIERSMRPFTGACLRVVACPWDVRETDDMTPADLTVVAVDSPIARRVVHSSDTIFLDLRTLADGFIALDSSVDRDFVTRMTPDQPARSCQHEGAVKSGNIEFGFLLAAAHGAQWVLQSLRWMVGHELAMPPLPQSANVTFGTLGRMPLAEEELEPQGSVKPKFHPPNLITSCIDTNDHNSEVIREHVACLAKRRWWRAIWELGDSMSREISVLIDADDKLFVDVGTSGQVKMSPPEDAKIPFQLWLHSHPLDAYWSSTDRDTLGCYVGLIREAVVLGHDHYKHTAHSESPESSLEEEGPLASWSSEPTVLYADDPLTLGPEDRKREGQT